MRNPTILILLSFFYFTNFATAQNNLEVLNVDSWWDNGKGSISNATIAVFPKGAYMEISMTLSLTDYNFPIGTDNLEIVFDFTLPDGAIIYDSWLWMLDGETIVQAEMEDIWTARGTYEDIVNRRTDPSILYRKEDGNYQIRVFPLTAGQNRKIKISYLAPAIWSKETVEVWLPTEILNASTKSLESTNFICSKNDNWLNPQIKGTSEKVLEEIYSEEYGDLLRTTLSRQDLLKPLRFSVDAPYNEDGLYLQNLEEGEDKFYQLAYLPSKVEITDKAKNIIFVNNHIAQNCQIQKTELISYLKEACINNLDEKDKFNFVTNNINGSNLLSDYWLHAEPSTIDRVFDDLNAQQLSNTSLNNLLSEAISFVKYYDEPTEIIVLASSDDFYENNLNSILGEIGELDIKVHIINYNTLAIYNSPNPFASDQWHYQSKDAYSQLTAQTSGKIYGSLEGTANVWTNIFSVFKSLTSSNYEYDLHTSTENGFTYDRYQQDYLNLSRLPNETILQIGRYIGEPSFEIDFSAKVDDNFIYESAEILGDSDFSENQFTRKMWFGHHIETLSNIPDIINMSKEERVLSDFIALLALDLSEGGDPCVDCWDLEEFAVSTDPIEEQEERFEILASPNPFSEICTVTIQFDKNEKLGEIIATVFDAFGNQVLTQKLSDFESNEGIHWEWDGTDALGNKLPAGIYYITIKTQKNIKTIKLILVN